MASPGQMVQVMADVLGVSKATVIQYDRVLSESGLRSKSGRGTSAAKITSRDAANLLIALAASPLFGFSAKDVAENCKVYASLLVQPASQAWSKNFASFGLRTLANLPEGHSFGEALSALIDAAAQGECFKQPERGKKRYSMNTFFEIQFIAPGPSGEILADGTKDFGLQGRLIYAKGKPSKRRRTIPKADFLKIPDLRQTSSISFKTIRALGALVGNESCPTMTNV